MAMYHWWVHPTSAKHDYAAKSGQGPSHQQGKGNAEQISRSFTFKNTGCRGPQIDGPDSLELACNKAENAGKHMYLDHWRRRGHGPPAIGILPCLAAAALQQPPDPPTKPLLPACALDLPLPPVPPAGLRKCRRRHQRERLSALRRAPAQPQPQPPAVLERRRRGCSATGAASRGRAAPGRSRLQQLPTRAPQPRPERGTHIYFVLFQVTIDGSHTAATS